MYIQKVLEKLNKIVVYAIWRYRGVTIDIEGKTDDYGVYTLGDIIPDDAVVLSFGIGTDTSFEEAVLSKYSRAHVYAFDPTPKSIKYVKKLEHEQRFHFFPCGLSKEDGYEIFFLPKDEESVSCSTIKNQYSSNNEIKVEMKSFASVVEMCGLSQIDVLKMDIEGTEFAVINDIMDSQIEILQLCLEIHPGFFDNRFCMSRSFIHTMIKNGYKISHITRHGLGDELSFIKV